MLIMLTDYHGNQLALNPANIVGFVKYENQKSTTVYCTSFKTEGISIFSVRESVSEIAKAFNAAVSGPSAGS